MSNRGNGQAPAVARLRSIWHIIPGTAIATSVSLISLQGERKPPLKTAAGKYDKTRQSRSVKDHTMTSGTSLAPPVEYTAAMTRIPLDSNDTRQSAERRSLRNAQTQNGIRQSP